MDIKEILERIKTDPDYRAQLQSELAFPMYQPGHAGQPVEQIDKLEASFGSIDDLINSININKNINQDSASDYSNYGSVQSVAAPSFEAPNLEDAIANLKFDKDVVDFDEAALDDKINEGMVAGLNNFINEAYTPHAMDYLASDDIYDPTQLAIKKYNNSEADKYFDKALDRTADDERIAAAQRWQDIKDSDDPENRRLDYEYMPQGVQPEDDIEHYEQALKVLQERKANRVKALENARANMAAAAWMYRKDPSLLSALFSEKSSERIAKAGKESQEKAQQDAYMEAYDRQKRIYQYAVKQLEENTDPKQDARLLNDVELASIDLMYKAKKAGMTKEYDDMIKHGSPKQIKIANVKNFQKAIGMPVSKFADEYAKADSTQKERYKKLIADNDLTEEDVGIGGASASEANKQERTNTANKKALDFKKKYKNKQIKPDMLGKLTSEQKQERANIEKEAKAAGVAIGWDDNGHILYK